MFRSARTLSLILVVAGLAAPTAAHASKPHKVTYPVISSVVPLHVKVGDKLIIRGKNFRVGKAANTVVFKRDGRPAVFVKSQLSTHRMMTVIVPDKLGPQLATDASASAQPTPFKLRVIATRFALAYTAGPLSPVISPRPITAGHGSATPPADGGGASGALDAYQKCQSSVPANPGADADADGMANAVETASGTDPCDPDTDGDGVLDGYEYYSAIDLNGAAVPYPGKRPWPNPLDPTDANSDFDGDGLTMAQEFKLWKYASGTFPLTAYSDGTQNTGGPQPVTTLAQQYLDLSGDGNLTDDERDADGDGLSNMVELNTTGTQHWWNAVKWNYQPHGGHTPYVEPPYTIRLFNDLSPIDPDTDGDTIPDGADDQDNDGWSNFVEMQLARTRTGYRVHPFNPCLPDPHSLTCSRYIPLDGKPWPPFDDVDPGVTSQLSGDAMPFGWPNQVYNAWVLGGSVVPGAPVLTGPWNPSAGFFVGAWDGKGGPQGP